MTNYPDDADGAALADLAAQGADMSQPMPIEFPVTVPDETSAHKTATAMTKLGYDSHIEHDEGEPDFDPKTDDPEEFGPSWMDYANVEMVPEYAEIVRIQAELDRIARPFGGKSDGWGVMLDGDAEE